MSMSAPRSEAARCLDARMGLAYYRMMFTQHRSRRGLNTPWPPGRKPRSCADARYLADVWRERARNERKVTERFVAFVNSRLIRDYPFCEDCHAWPSAVQEVQKVFPGTFSWLMSCSAAEGGWGRWVGYGGQPYSTWLRDSDTVGGPMQFRFSTFQGMYRRGHDYLTSNGFRTNVPREMTAAWRSSTGQAIAAGWARYTGNDNRHWSASWGRGC